MKFKEFLDYLEKNLTGYQIFMRKALAYQTAKNLKRTPKSRWNDRKVDKAAYEVWKMSMDTLYYKIKQEVKSDSPFIWADFMRQNNILEVLNEGINEMDFSDDGAA